MLSHISKAIEKRDGHPNLQFVTAVRKCNMEERMLASTLLKDILEADLMQFDESARKVMSARCPGVDFSKVSIYGDAIDFLKK